MKKITTGIILVLTICMIAGCGKSATKDSYVEGTDFQYQYLDSFASLNKQAKGKKASYFVIGSYIYQLDEKAGLLTPLCNKSNCLHDKEKDEKRMEECNAYISEDAGIAYMDGYIYTVMLKCSENDICDTLYKISEDGATKEKVYQWNGQVVDNWCVHRNVCYFVEHTYNADGQEFYKVKKLQLGGMGKKKPKIIYEPETNITVFALGALSAYGNHLYINVDGAKTKDVKKVAKKDWAKKSYNKTFQYDLKKNTISEIRVPQQSETEQVSTITFWQNKLLIHVMDCEKLHQYDAKSNVYTADLDGKNVTVLLKDMPAYREYSSDGTYLYISDCVEALDRIYSDPKYQYNTNHDIKKKYDFTVKIDVYDKKMKRVDQMESPIKSFPTELPYGIGERMYVLEKDKSGNGVSLAYWDKKKLGTYHGKEYTFTKLLEQTYSVHDQQQLQEESGEE